MLEFHRSKLLLYDISKIDRSKLIKIIGTKERFQTSFCTSTKDRGKVWHGFRALARLFAEGDTLTERCRSEEWLRPILVFSWLVSLVEVVGVDLRARTIRLDCTSGCFLGVEKSSSEASDSIPDKDLTGCLSFSMSQEEFAGQSCCSKAFR
jgi:hypothetical protein